MTSVGSRIKSARLSIGLSQVELAIAAKVSQPTVANWENDSHAPRQKALSQIAKLLNTSTGWLLTGNANENGHNLAPTQYLKTPLRHIPVEPWPMPTDIKDGALSPSMAHDYIGVSIDAQNPFALLANDPAMAAYFPIGALIIFDAVPGELEEGGCYLFEQSGVISLRRWQSAPDRLEALPNHSAVDADFVAERPAPLARAIMSVRKH